MNYNANAKRLRLRAGITLVALGIILGNASIPAFAVEGAVGRTLPGIPDRTRHGEEAEPRVRVSTGDQVDLVIED